MLFMCVQTSLRSCLVFTFPTVELPPFVDWFLVSDEISFMFCLVFTITALELLSFMDWSLVLREVFCVAWYSHSLHWNFCPSWIDFWCVVRLPFVVAWYSHSLHWNFCPSWIDFWCVMRWAFCVAWYSHSLHWNFSLHVLLLMLIEPLSLCCLIATYFTRIFCFLMYRIMMNLKHSFSCSCILALVTGKHLHVFSITDQGWLMDDE